MKAFRLHTRGGPEAFAWRGSAAPPARQRGAGARPGRGGRAVLAASQCSIKPSLFVYCKSYAVSCTPPATVHKVPWSKLSLDTFIVS